MIPGEGATTRNGNTAQLSVKELLSGCRDLMKTQMKAALAEDIEAEMAEFPGAAARRVALALLIDIPSPK
ncbi:hypothetical protein CCR84_13525 [Rhodocyclus purpureus]|nr:hypothetical protein [Rhodocyclus purpureus]